MENYITIKKLAQFHNINEALLLDLAQAGVLEIHIVNSEPCAAHNQLEKYERAIRLHRDLGVNKEGVEIIMEMRDKMEALQKELNELKRKLSKYDEFMTHSFYEDFFDTEI